jgi:hypothetical protein
MAHQRIALDHRTALLSFAVVLQASKSLHRGLNLPEGDEWPALLDFCRQSRRWVQEAHTRLRSLTNAPALGELDMLRSKVRGAMTPSKRLLDEFRARIIGARAACALADYEVEFIAQSLERFQTLLDGNQPPTNDTRKALAQDLIWSATLLEQRCGLDRGYSEADRVVYYRAPIQGRYVTIEEIIKDTNTSR